MMSTVTVRIPTPLRAFTGGAGSVPVEGESVGRALEALVARHRDLGQHLFTADGGLRNFINVYVNDTNVRALQGLDSALADGAVLHIVPAVAGGRS